MTIKFDKKEAPKKLKLDAMYIFEASLREGQLYEDIGKLVQEAAQEADPDRVKFIGAIQTPGLTLSAKLKKLWLVFKESTNTTSGSYAIVADLKDFEIDFLDEKFIGPLAALIPGDAQAVLRVNRVVYSHNLYPNISGTRGTDVFDGAGNLRLDWPFDFGAGMLLHCTFSFAGKEMDMRLEYKVPAYSIKGTYKKTDDVASLLSQHREAQAKEAEAAKTEAAKEIAEKRKKAFDQLAKDAPTVKPGGAPKKLDTCQRKGPVSIDSVSGTLKLMSVEFDITAGLALGPLNCRIINFQIELFLEDLAKPRVDLDGVGLAYESSALSVAGALFKQKMIYQEEKKEEKKTLTTTAFHGGLLVKTPAFGLAAIASLAQIKVDGDDELSLFVFAMLQAKAGFTFLGIVTINGLAFTLGYNRDFLVPTDTSDIPDHPLIRLVEAGGPPKDKKEEQKNGKKEDEQPAGSAEEGKDKPTPEFDAGGDLVALLGALEAIREFVPIKPHKVVAGIGLKANLVQLIDLFLMPVVSINIDSGDLAIQLYGTASMALPKGAKEGAAVLNLEAALAAEIPIKGDQPLIIGLAITEGSYFLRPFLKIEGGLAFYRHKGVMLFTIGGYGPLYRGVRPNWPTAKPLSIALQASDNVYMTGSFYFSRLPDAITFGLDFEGSAQIGGSHFSVGASFDIGANALLIWAPFYYEVEIHACFALYVKASLKIGWGKLSHTISKTLSFDLSAKLHVWGNETEKWNGKAELTVHLLFTFHPTIEWGEPIGDFQPLYWREFKEQFLPHPEDKADKIASGQCQVTGGVVDHEGKDKIPVVSPSAFEAEAKVFLPVTHCTVNGESVPLADNRVGIQMIGLVKEHYTASMIVKVRKDGTEVGKDRLHREPITADLPVALWTPAMRSGMVDKPDPNGPKVVEDVPVGVRIRSHEPEEQGSHAVDKQNLAFDPDEGANIECRASGRLEKGVQSTEEAVATSMVEHRPDARVLAALGIEDAEVSFQRLKDTDLVGVPHLA